MPVDPKLPRLPSVSELLQHPRVKGLLGKVNQSTAATRAADFFSELRQTVQDQAGKFELPALPHLAEQFARRLLGEARQARQVVNATGAVIDCSLGEPPLAEAAVHAMLATAGDYRQCGSKARKEVSKTLEELAVAEGALVTGSFEGALRLAVHALATQRELCVVEASGQAGRDWQRLAVGASAILRNRSSLAEQTNDALVLRVAGIDCDTEENSLERLTAEASQRTLIDVTPIAGVLNPQIHDFPAVPALADRIQSGADLVISDGGGLLGGPSCGLLVGKGELIDKIAAHPLAAALAPNNLILEPLSVTLGLYRTPAQVPFAVPIWQLLSTPLANLEQRAERLARLAGECQSVARAAAREVESTWLASGQQALKSASWAIAIQPQDQSAEVFCQRLAKSNPAVVARIEQDEVILDLRAVFPRWDQTLIAAIDKAG